MLLQQTSITYKNQRCKLNDTFIMNSLVLFVCFYYISSPIGAAGLDGILPVGNGNIAAGPGLGTLGNIGSLANAAAPVAGLANAAAPVAGLVNAAAPVAGLASAANPVAGLGNVANQAANAVAPVAGLASAAAPVAGLASAAAPLAGLGNAAAPLAGLGNAAAPVAGLGNAAAPVAGLANAAAPVAGLVNSAAPVVGLANAADAVSGVSGVASAPLAGIGSAAAIPGGILGSTGGIVPTAGLGDLGGLLTLVGAILANLGLGSIGLSGRSLLDGLPALNLLQPALNGLNIAKVLYVFADTSCVLNGGNLNGALGQILSTCQAGVSSATSCQFNCTTITLTQGAQVNGQVCNLAGSVLKTLSPVIQNNFLQCCQSVPLLSITPENTCVTALGLLNCLCPILQPILGGTIPF